MAVAPAVTETTYFLFGSNLGPLPTVWPYGSDDEVTAFLDIADGNGPQELAQPAQFTVVSSLPLAGGGDVYLNGALLPGALWPDGTRATLARLTSNGQPSVFGEDLGFSPAACEAALDNVERQVQELRTDAERAVTLSFGETGGMLPPADERAGNLLGFDAGGDPIMVPPGAPIVVPVIRTQTMLESLTALAATAIDPSVKSIYVSNYALPGDGGGQHLIRTTTGPGIGRHADATGAWWLIDELIYRFEMFGAKGDGVTDDYQAMIDTVTIGAGQIVQLMEKTYRNSATLTCSYPIRLQGTVPGRNNGITYGSCIKAIGAINVLDINIVTGPPVNPVPDEHGGEISNIIIDGNATGLQGLRIVSDIGDAIGWVLRNITATNLRSSGFSIGEGWGHVLDNCVAANCGQGLLGAGFSFSGGAATMNNCSAQFNINDGIAYAGNASVVINGGYVKGSGHHGLNVFNNAANLTVNGTLFDVNGNTTPATYCDIFHGGTGVQHCAYNDVTFGAGANTLHSADIRGTDCALRNPKNYSGSARILFRAGQGSVFEGNVTQLDPASVFNGCICINTAPTYGSVSIGGIASSGTPIVNPVTNGPVEAIFLTAGTVSLIVVTYPNSSNHTHTGAAFVGLRFLLPPGATITITYTVAPTWKWISHPAL